MKKIILFASFLLATTFSMAQCEPMFDFGEEPFGVMPDTVTGFVDGEVDVLYVQQVDVKVPENADFTGVPGIVVDSIRIVSMTGLPPGLSLDCNENTSTECTYSGGSTGCAIITGVPTSGGDFGLNIILNIYATSFLGPTEIPYEFNGYSIFIDGPVGIEDQFAVQEIKLQPNPASSMVTLKANTTKSGEAVFAVYDLVGKQIFQKSVQVTAGTNLVKYNTSELPEGIYICKFDAFGESHTTRLVVVH